MISAGACIDLDYLRLEKFRNLSVIVANRQTETAIDDITWPERALYWTFFQRLADGVIFRAYTDFSHTNLAKFSGKL